VEDGAIAFKDFAKPLAQLASTIDDLLQGKPATFSWNALMTGEAPKPRELRRLIRVSPVLDFDALEPGAAASETIRKEAVVLGLTPDHGVRVRLTGPVAMADEEFATVADGALLNVLLTAAAVLLILWFALRSARVIFAVMLSLFAGLVITAALGLAMVGALNLISVAFAVLFVGIGVDFGIQFAVRYRAERHRNNNLNMALGSAAKRIAKPLSLAAAATAAGFYAFLPTAYLGVSELGLIAGTGMIVAFFTSITMVPALLTLLRAPAEPEAIGYRSLAPVDRFMAKYRIPILIGTLIIVLAGLPLLAKLKFDFNPLNLRSAKVESVATLLELMKEPETSPNAINILIPSLGEAPALTAKLSALPEVSETLTLQSFVPEKQEEKLAIIGDAASLLNPTLDVAEIAAVPTDEETREALLDAAKAYRDMKGDDAERAEAAKMAQSLQALADSAPERRAEVEKALLSGLKLRLEQIRASLKAEAVNSGVLHLVITRHPIASPIEDLPTNCAG